MADGIEYSFYTWQMSWTDSIGIKASVSTDFLKTLPKNPVFSHFLGGTILTSALLVNAYLMMNTSKK